MTYPSILPLEKLIQRDILAYLGYRGVKAIRINSGQVRSTRNGRDDLIRMAPTGTPDIIGCLGRAYGANSGRMILIEVKRPGKSPTEIQHQVHEEWREFGAYVFVCNSVDQIEEKLDQIMKGMI